MRRILDNRPGPRRRRGARRRVIASGEGDGGGDYKVRAYFDNAGFLVNGRGGADRRRHRRHRRGGRRSRCPASRSSANGDEDPGKAVAVLDITDPGFQDFLHRRDLPDPPAVAARREVRRVRADPAARSSLTEPPPRARADPRRRDRRGPVLPADREQRQAGRPRPRQQHHPPARGRALPADPQRPRRRPRGPRPRPRAT